MAAQPPGPAVKMPKNVEALLEQNKRELVRVYYPNLDTKDLDAAYKVARPAMEVIVGRAFQKNFKYAVEDAQGSDSKGKADLKATLTYDENNNEIVSIPRVDRNITSAERLEASRKAIKESEGISHENDTPDERKAFIVGQYALYAWEYMAKNMNDYVLAQNYDKTVHPKSNKRPIEINGLRAEYVSPEKAEKMAKEDAAHADWMSRP